MTLNEWYEKYEAKSKEKHIEPDGFRTLYDNDKGYAQVKIDGDFIIVYEVCGDGRYWYERAIEIAKANNCHWLFTICTRNILPYIRLMKCKWTKKETVPEFHNAIKGEGINHLGNKFVVLPAWHDSDKKTLAYNVYSEVIKQNEN